MFRSIGGALVLCGLLTASVAAAEDDRQPRVSQLRVEPRGRDVFIGFTVAGALDPGLAKKMEAGLETAIRYDIRLYRRYPYWFDDFVEQRRYRVAATHDPVTREYAIEETLDGKPLRKTATREFAEAARLLLSRENLLAFHVERGKPTRNLYVQMRASFDAGYVFTIIPVDSRTPWKKSKRFNVRATPR
ncbi:MAG TPA: DUF4390 domain-containing protein [Thermoanaerobaculia bacterium]|nr:DUF4390 domain-containing protein [Thermoanaerobaculia bacterium]